MSGRIERITIVGGGTAGWLTALIINKHLAPHGDRPVNITLIESPNIATIGVGEATIITLPKLMQLIEDGKIDPSFVITHVAPLENGPDLYQTFREKKDGCIKVVLKPGLKEASKISGKETAHA